MFVMAARLGCELKPRYSISRSVLVEAFQRTTRVLEPSLVVNTA